MCSRLKVSACQSVSEVCVCVREGDGGGGRRGGGGVTESASVCGWGVWGRVEVIIRQMCQLAHKHMIVRVFPGPFL